MGFASSLYQPDTLDVQIFLASTVSQSFVRDVVLHGFHCGRFWFQNNESVCADSQEYK